jgi:hypothetical protein
MAVHRSSVSNNCSIETTANDGKLYVWLAGSKIDPRLSVFFVPTVVPPCRLPFLIPFYSKDPRVILQSLVFQSR